MKLGLPVTDVFSSSLFFFQEQAASFKSILTPPPPPSSTQTCPNMQISTLHHTRIPDMGPWQEQASPPFKPEGAAFSHFLNLPVCPCRDRTDVNVWVTEYWKHKGCLGFEVAGEMTSKTKGPQAPLIVCVPQWIINDSSWRTAREQEVISLQWIPQLKKKKIWEEVSLTKRWKRTFFTVCF